MNKSTRSRSYNRLPGDGAILRARSRRRGSTLLVVIALTGMLALLGVMFFSFASQELENSRNFNRAAALLDNPEHPAEVYFNFALKQLVQGSDPNQKNSVIYGPRHSIIGSMFGHDSHPFNGQGVHLSEDGLRQPFIDPGFDGTALAVSADGNGNWWEDPQMLLNINDSPAANAVLTPGSEQAVERQLSLLPAPDVDYTYPDINNVFLAYRGFTRELYNEDVNDNGMLDPGEDLNGNGIVDINIVRTRRVIKPSFHRPELLAAIEQDFNGNGSIDSEDTNGNGVLDPGEDTNNNGLLDFEDFDNNGALTMEDINGNGTVRLEDANHDGIPDDANGDGIIEIEDINGNGADDELVVRDLRWAYNGWTQSRIMRPHPGHVSYVIDPQTRDAVPTTIRRFLDDRVTSGPDAAIISGLPGGSGGFLFVNDPDGDGIPNEQGVWSYSLPRPGQDYQYEYDLDNDNDGILDGILMDLDYKPEQRPSDGALYVPLFSFTVYDAGGLLNLNITGNLSGNTAPPGGGTFGGGESVSQSLHGLSTAEINPTWALKGYPGADVDTGSLSDYDRYFGLGGRAVDRFELANMAFWCLNKGYVEFSSSGGLPTIHAGRLGEEDRIWQVYQDAGGTNLIALNTAGSYQQFPFPGYWSADDNGNRNEGGGYSPFGIRAFGHPISYSGAGSFTDAGDPKTPHLVTPVAGRVPFPRYTNMGLAGDVNWRTLLGGSLMVSPSVGVLGGTLAGTFPADDMMEITLEDITGDNRWSVMNVTTQQGQGAVGDGSQRQTFDEPFDVSDSAVLRLSQTDVTNTQVTSRIVDALPAHLDPANNDFAVDNRKMFTPASWDRKQFSLLRSSLLSADGAPGAAGVDDNQDGVIDNYSEIGWPGTDDVRAWEFNVDLDGDGLAEFPPQFGVGAYAGMTQFSPHPSSGAVSTVARIPDLPQDPFRAQIRRMLEVEIGNTGQQRLQFPISINHLMDVVRTPPAPGQRAYVPGDPAFSPLEYRQLTPHPPLRTPATVTNVPEINAASALPAYPPSNDTQREWWARYDRQRMARDFYVLLYTLCGGNDSRNYTTNGAGNVPYSREQCRQMAQFAVNLVDSLDRDHAMTMFEYDTDLSDGWGLDDQAWDSSRDAQVAQRAVVFGVEEKQLAFTEALWLYAPQDTTDAKQTLYDETSQDHQFLYMELQNISPRDARLAETSSTSAGTAVWRIRRKFALADAQTSLGMVEPSRSVTNIPSGEEALYFRAGAGVVSAGDFYTIATADDYLGSATSRFYIDETDDMTDNFRPVVPRTGPTVSSTIDPNLSVANAAIDLDLTLTAPGGDYELVNGAGVRGAFLNGTTVLGGGAASENLTLVLERRLNPELPELPLTDNPWVTVDMMFLEREELDIDDSDDQMMVESKLQAIQSTFRIEPLRAQLAGASSSISNTIGCRIDSRVAQTMDPSTPATYTRYQRQLNRDFTSPVELFTLSLRGPKTINFAFDAMEDRPDVQQTQNLVPPELHEDPDGNGRLDVLDLNGDGNDDHDEDLNGNGFLDITHEDDGTDNRPGGGMGMGMGMGGGPSAGNANDWILTGGEDENGNGALESFAGPVSAEALFLQPNHPGSPPGGGSVPPGNRPAVPPGRGTQPGNRPDIPPGWTLPDANFNNRWHRLLAFVEVPTRSHQQLGDPLAVTRIPGRLNPNTIRHPEVLAALLDAPELFTAPEYDADGDGVVDAFEDHSGNGSFDLGLPGTPLDDPSRDFWFDLLQSRDGFDPVSYMALPGTSASKPFRGAGNLNGLLGSVEDTLLRTHPRAAVNGSSRRLFELGTDDESAQVGGATPVDRNLRHNLLSKVANNVTTRSNVFFVFVSVQFHEAYEDPVTGAVRIGGQFDLDSDGDSGNDGHRGFFVIDRSDVEQAFENNSFNWEDLIKYRLTIN